MAPLSIDPRSQPIESSGERGAVLMLHGLRPRAQNVAHNYMGHATQLEVLHGPM